MNSELAYHPKMCRQPDLRRLELDWRWKCHATQQVKFRKGHNKLQELYFQFPYAGKLTGAATQVGPLGCSKNVISRQQTSDCSDSCCMEPIAALWHCGLL